MQRIVPSFLLLQVFPARVRLCSSKDFSPLMKILPIQRTRPFNLFPFLNEEVKKWAENNILFVSRNCVQYELCQNCCLSVWREDDFLRLGIHKNNINNLYTDEELSSSSDNRNQSKGPSAQSPSTSKDPQEQAKPPGPEASDDTITSPAE